MKPLALALLLLCLAAPACSSGLSRQQPPGGPFAGGAPPGGGVGGGAWSWAGVFGGGLAVGVVGMGLWRWLVLRKGLARPGGRGLSRELDRLKNALGLVEQVLGEEARRRVVRLDKWRRDRRRRRL